MHCGVYTGRDGLVLVPDCMRASREAERLHGPLHHCGSFETDGLSADLARRIETALDDQLYAVMEPELALRLGYEPQEGLPLPHGFEWDLGDWWNNNEGAQLFVVRGGRRVAVAEVHADASRTGWYANTRLHRPWQFRGSRVAASRAAAIHFLTVWAVANADALAAEVAALLD
jgi:hypothetical protein